MKNQLEIINNDFKITAKITQNHDSTLEFHAEPTVLTTESFLISAQVTKSTIPQSVSGILEDPQSVYQFIQESPQNRLLIEQMPMQDQNDPSYFFVILFMIGKKQKKIHIAAKKQYLSKQKRLQIELENQKHKIKIQAQKLDAQTQRINALQNELRLRQSNSSNQQYLQRIRILESDNKNKAQRINTLQNQLRLLPSNSTFQQNLQRIRILQNQKKCLKSQLDQLRSRPNKKVHLDFEQEQKKSIKDSKNKRKESSSESSVKNQIDLGQKRKQQNNNALQEEEPQYVNYQPFETVSHIVKAAEKQKSVEKKQNKKNGTQDQERFSSSFSAILLQFIFQYCVVKLNNQNPQKPQKSVYQCFVCRKAFQNDTFLIRHLSGKHYESIDQKWTLADLKTQQRKYKSIQSYSYKVNRYTPTSHNTSNSSNNGSNIFKKAQVLQNFFSKYTNS